MNASPLYRTIAGALVVVAFCAASVRADDQALVETARGILAKHQEAVVWVSALVAMQEGRRSILCELSPEYAELAQRRLDAAWLDGAAQMDVFHDSAPTIQKL